MRQLNTSDLFKAARLIRKMGIKEDLKKFAEGINADQNQEEVGIDMLMLIFERATDETSEQLIYEFLAGPFEVAPHEVKEMELFTMVESLFKVADIEKWKGFFQGVLR